MIYLLHIYLQPQIAFGGLGASGENALEDVEMQQEQEFAQKQWKNMDLEPVLVMLMRPVNAIYFHVSKNIQFSCNKRI